MWVNNYFTTKQIISGICLQSNPFQHSLSGSRSCHFTRLNLQLVCTALIISCNPLSIAWTLRGEYILWGLAFCQNITQSDSILFFFLSWHFFFKPKEKQQTNNNNKNPEGMNVMFQNIITENNFNVCVLECVCVCVCVCMHVCDCVHICLHVFDAFTSLFFLAVGCSALLTSWQNVETHTHTSSSKNNAYTTHAQWRVNIHQKDTLQASAKVKADLQLSNADFKTEWTGNPLLFLLQLNALTLPLFLSR